MDGFEERGSYIQDIIYDADMDQIEVFLNRSTHCKQKLRFGCIRTRLFNSPYVDPESEFLVSYCSCTSGQMHKRYIVDCFLWVGEASLGPFFYFNLGV